MKKTITTCDKCGREIHKGEQYQQRWYKYLDSCQVHDMQDICRDCARGTMNTGGDKYKPLFFKAANREFWNIL